MEKVSWWNQCKERTQDLLKDCPDLRDTDSPCYPYHAKSRLSLCEGWIQAHCSHLSHKNDYPGARDDCWCLAVISRTRTAKKQKNPKNDDLFGMRNECKFLQSNSHTRTTKEAEETIERQRRKRRIIFSAQMSNLGTQCWHFNILNSSTVFEAIRHVTIPSWSLDHGLSACQAPTWICLFSTEIFHLQSRHPLHQSLWSLHFLWNIFSAIAADLNYVLLLG